jgi:protein-arginine kinase activator protein McsA
MKVCTKCGAEKSLEEYDRNKNHKDGHDTSCKVCKRTRHELKTYGVTREELLKKTPSCPICDVTFADIPERHIHIDHNHETGKTRNLLCHSCNTALGGFRDSPEILTNAIKYLEKHNDTVTTSSNVPEK